MVVNGSNNSGSNHKLFPGFGNVNVVNTFLISGVDVVLHLGRTVMGSEIGFGSKHQSKICVSGFRVWEMGLTHFEKMCFSF